MKNAGTIIAVVAVVIGGIVVYVFVRKSGFLSGTTAANGPNAGHVSAGSGPTYAPSYAGNETAGIIAATGGAVNALAQALPGIVSLFSSNDDG